MNQQTEKSPIKYIVLGVVAIFALVLLAFTNLC